MVQTERRKRKVISGLDYQVRSDTESLEVEIERENTDATLNGMAVRKPKLIC